MDFEAVQLTVGAASCCVYLLVCCSFGLAWARGAARAGDGLRGCARLLRRQCWKLGRWDPQALSMMERERIVFVKQRACYLAPPLLVFIVAFSGMRSLNGLVVGSGEILWHTDNVQISLLLVACVVVQGFPDCVTTRSLHFFYVVLCMYPVCSAIAGLDVTQRSENTAVVWADLFRRFFLQAIVGGSTCKPKVACTVAMLQGILRTVAFWLRGDDAPSRNPLFDMVMATSMCFWFVLEHMRFLGVVRCSLETFELIELRLLCLLYALYDVVVTLDTDLRVAARAPKLDLLLNTRDAQGTRLTDFMGPTDRGRFLEFVARAPPDVTDGKSNPTPAQSLNVHLQDGRGSWIQVQLFHTQFQNIGCNQVEHLIGICEVGDSGGRAAGGEFGCVSGISAGRDSSRALTGTSVVSTTRAYTDQDSDCSLIAGDSASMAGAPSVPAKDPVADSESLVAEPPEQEEVDLVAPLRGESEDRPAGFPRQQPALQPGEIGIVFDTLRFTIRHHQSGQPVVDASLLAHESLQQWVAGWWSCRAFMQDFVNAMLRPVSSESWPSNVGPPSIASFRVAFRGSCRLPPDVLTRSAVPLALPAGVEQRRRSSPDGDGAAALGGWGPPVRLKVTRVSLSRSRREDRQSRSHSRERGAPSPPVRGHGGPVAVAPQRGRLAQAAPAATAIGVPQSWRESVDSRGENESLKGSSREGSERCEQI